MSKKHYGVIAAIIGNAKARARANDRPTEDIEQLARDLADFMLSDNARFDHVRFLEAVGAAS